jgi:hypothetical protein
MWTLVRAMRRSTEVTRPRRPAPALAALIVLLAAAVALGAGCDDDPDQTGPRGSGGMGPDGDTCRGEPSNDCIQGARSPEGGTLCSDIGAVRICTDGQWVCPRYSVPIATCTCFSAGRGGTCGSCTPSGWSCPPDGADPSTDPDAGGPEPRSGGRL